MSVQKSQYKNHLVRAVKRIWYAILVGAMIPTMLFSQHFSTVDNRAEVVSVKEGVIGGAIIENVILHSRESRYSHKRINRKGMLVKYPDAQATVVISHGFMCDRFDSGFLRQLFPANRFNIMTFDFRAHGDDRQGQYCTFGRDEVYDVFAAVDFVRNHPELKNKPVIGYGFSMGAVSTIEAQAKDSSLFDAMILDCPFASSEQVLHSVIDKMKITLFGYQFSMPGNALLKKYIFHPYVQAVVKNLLKTFAHIDTQDIVTSIGLVKPAESIKKVSVPCMFIHCKNDERVSVKEVKSIYYGAAGYKSLWITNGRRHCDSFFYNPERYKQRVANFVDYVIGGDVSLCIDQGIIEDNVDEMCECTQGK